MRPTRRRPRSGRGIARPGDKSRPGAAQPGADARGSTIEQVSAFLKCRPQDLIKTLIYLADGQPIAVLVRGDHEANEGKIRRACLAAPARRLPWTPRSSNWPPPK